MGRRRVWKFSPGETRDIGVSMASELGTADVLTGSTPAVSATTRSGSAGAYTYTAATGFTFSNEQTNSSEEEAADGETIGIGKGIFFRVTAPPTTGRYYIRSECDADDGTHVVRTPYDILDVEGPQAP